MKLGKIQLVNFRNYENISIDIRTLKNVFLIGKNGQGKSNFLEALYYLGYGKSFRSSKEENVVLHSKDFYKIVGVFYHDDLEYTLEISYEKKRKTIIYNGTKLKNKSDILHIFPCLIFKHSDIFFISGGPSFQRQYLDQVLALNHHDYLYAFQKYKRTLQQKNTALKDKNYEIISIYNEQLTDFGYTIIKYRYKIIEYINKNITNLFSKIFGEEISIRLDYVPGWNFNINQSIIEIRKNILNNISKYERQEQQQKKTLTGPHRDLITIMLGSKEAKNTASTGQIRLLSLLLRVLQANYYYLQRKTPMIYLFDDVLLELDTEKQRSFLGCLPSTQQSFYTFLPEESLPHTIEADIESFFTIEKGKIVKHEKI